MNKVLIPELRFPEFQKTEGWLRTTIGETGRFYYGKSAPKWSLAEDAPTLCVRYGELYTKFDTVISKINSRTNIDPSNLRFSKGGEILIPRVGEIPKDFAENVCYLPFPNIAIGEMISVYETSEHSIFYAYYFRTLGRQFSEVVEGQNVKNLYYANLEPIAIGKPTYSEQKKIALFLSSLDEVIAAHCQKLELLKAHKKGLVQNLFPQKGERMPKYRFPRFANEGKWEKKKLGDKDVSCFVSEKVSVDKLNIYSYISTENMLPEFSGVLTAKRLPALGSFTKFKNEDILISNIRPYLKKVWKADKIGGASNDVLVFRSGSEVLSEFLECIIKNEAFINYVMESAKGVKMPRGDKDSMLKYIVFIPSKKEQREIASCLFALDTLITSQTGKIEQLKLHKKGLIQGLFPKMND